MKSLPATTTATEAAASAPRLIAASRSGFTLLELIVVMSIMMLMIGVGVGSFAYFDSKDPFEDSVMRLRRMSKHALQAAVIQHQRMNIVFTKNSFSLLGDSSTDGGSYTLPGGLQMEIFHWGGKQWEKSDGQVWPFGEQGICEPIVVRFENDTDHVDTPFHPLTGMPIVK